MFNTAARSGLSHGTGHATNSTPSRQRTQYCHIHPGHRAASARSAAEADMMAGRIRIPPLLSERDAKGSHKIVLRHRVRRHPAIW